MNTDPLIRVAVGGSPGAGKSTLVARMQFAASGRRIAVGDLASLDSFAGLVTSASAADVAIIVVDATAGLDALTTRDLAMVSLLRVRRVVLAVSKMDDVSFRQDAFDAVVAQFTQVVAALRACGVQAPEWDAVPVVAMSGDTIAEHGARLPWYSGPPLLDLLAFVRPIDQSQFAGRFPVQVVIRPRTAEHPDYRGYAGRVEAGVFRPGDRVQALPSGWFSHIQSIDTASGPLTEAGVGRSVTLRLRDELDVPRGETLVADRDPRPSIVRELDTTLFWFGRAPAAPGSRFRLRHGTRDVLALIDAVQSRFDPVTSSWVEADRLTHADTARVRVRLADSVVVDRYEDSRTTGAVVLIDEATGVTVAAGLVH